MNMRFLAGIPLLALLTNPIVWADELPQAVTKKQEMVVSANPLASKAGADILRKGGTAADAMVAVQTVLGLVEPQSSGIGGGAFVVYYDARTGTTTTIDAREKAPATATEDRFSGLGFFSAWQSGLSVGVPGTPRMMEYVHSKYGKLKWKELFKEAEKLAKKGYPLTERTSSQVAGLLARNPSCEVRLFFRDPTAFEYFAESCEAKPAGTKIKNPEYAKTMNTLAKEGADGFYTGEIAENIAAAVQGDLAIGGDMTVADLANYDVVERAPVCIVYRGHNVCGMGPPSSGALAVGQILGILENPVAARCQNCTPFHPGRSAGVRRSWSLCRRHRLRDRSCRRHAGQGISRLARGVDQRDGHGLGGTRYATGRFRPERTRPIGEKFRHQPRIDC